jgi:hypothetical protein
MKGKKARMFFIFIAIGIVCVVGYSLGDYRDEVSSCSLLPRYNGIQALYDASDIIVSAEISKVNEPFVVDRRDYYMIPDDLTKDDFMPSYSKYVISEASVDKVLKGSLEDQALIEVIQETTMDNQNSIELEEVKIFKEKEKYVLFLKYYNPDSEQAIKDFKTPKYMIVGMYQGQFEVKNDKVRLSEEQKHILNNKSKGLFSQNMTLEDFEQMIQGCNPVIQ